jgi:uncharacterized protein YfaS (alpha-2-macroglobulin family)
MQRILLFCNAVLALLLVLRWVDGGAPVRAAMREEAAAVAAWREDQLRLVPCSTAVPWSGEARRPAGQQWLLHLGVAAAPEHDAAVARRSPEPVEVGLVAEPALALACFWDGAEVLRIQALEPLRPATNYRWQFRDALVARDGRRLPAGSGVVFATPGAELVDAVLEELPGTAPAAAGLRLQFSAPVELDALHKHLRLVDAGNESTVPCQLHAIDPDGCGYRVIPQVPALPDTLRVVVAAGLPTRGGALLAQQSQQRELKWREPLQWRGLEAGDEGLLLAFNHGLAGADPSTFRVTPAVDCKVEATSRGLRLRGEFPPGTVVTLDLAAGFPGIGRKYLAQPLRRAVIVPDRAARLEFVGAGEVLSARAEPVVVVRGCNQTRLRLRLYRLYDNNLVRMLQDRDLRVYAPAVEIEREISVARNVEWTERIDLASVLGTVSPGYYRLELQGEDDYWPKRRVLQITDLGVSVRAGHDAAAVQVVAIHSGAPVAGALVSVRTPTNQVLASGASDADGIARLAWTSAQRDQTPFAVLVEHADDRACIGLAAHATELADPGLGGRRYLRRGREAQVWPSRGIVRPGEPLHCAVLVRDATAAAAPGAVLLTAVGPGGKVLHRQRLKPSVAGLAAAVIELPADAPAGRWLLRVAELNGVWLGEAACEVAAFVPNRLEAEVAIEGEAVLEAPLMVGVIGRWLDGTPAAERPATVRVRLLPGQFAAELQPEASFRGNGKVVPPGELPPVATVLDAAGRASVRVALPATAAHQVLQAVVTAEVQDPSGRVVRAETQRLLLRAPFVLGLAAEPTRLRLLALTPAQQLADGIEAAVALRVERRRWVQEYQESAPGRWHWRSRVAAEVLHEGMATLAAGRAEWALPPLPGEWLVAVARHGAVEVEQALTAVPRAPDRLRVRAANRPAPGELAWLEIEAPAAGRAFVTLESDTVHTAAGLALQAGHNRVAVAVPAGLQLPNLHAVVTLTRAAPEAQAGQGPAFLLGGADLPLARAEVATPVALTAPAEVLPETSLALRIDAPGASSAVVAVVDEGVLALTGHRVADPVAHFLASRALAVRGADLHAALVQEMKFVARGKTGGDGGDEDAAALLRGGSVDPHIRPLAWWSEVALRDGSGEVRMALPPYEGRVRVMVLAAGPRGMGAAEQSVVVKGPLSLQVALPRMVAPGDRLELPITLRQDLGARERVRLGVQLPTGLSVVGPVAGAVAAADAGSPPWFAFDLAAGLPTTIALPLQVASSVEGPQTLRFWLQAGNLRRELAVVLSVRALRMPERDLVAVALAERGELPLAPGFLPDRLQAELVYDVAPERQLQPALLALLEYPYGCCEQTTSRGMALLAVAALLPRLFPEPATRPPVTPLAQAAVDRVSAMQTTRGGFGWWLGDTSEDPALTLWVVDFLRAARDAGLAVDESVLSRGLDRVAALAKASAGLPLRCQAVELLVRCGRPAQPELDWLAQQPLERTSRWRLAIALAGLGETARAKALLQDSEAPVAAATVVRTPFDSPFCREVLRLRVGQALEPGSPTHAPAVAALQQQLLRPELLTTQELAVGLQVVADHYQRLAVAAATGPLTVTVGDQSLQLAPGERTRVAIQPGAMVRWQGGAAGFLLASWQGLRPPAPRTDARLQLRRQWIDVATGLPVAEVQRGRVYEVRIDGEAAEALADLVFVDLLPGGLEPEPRLPDADDADHDDDQESGAAAGGVALLAAPSEARDDRVLRFPSRVPAGRFQLRHRVRATLPGDYAVPPLQAQAMYDPGLVVVSQELARLVVKP